MRTLFIPVARLVSSYPFLTPPFFWLIHHHSPFSLPKSKSLRASRLEYLPFVRRHFNFPTSLEFHCSSLDNLCMWDVYWVSIPHSSNSPKGFVSANSIVDSLYKFNDRMPESRSVKGVFATPTDHYCDLKLIPYPFRQCPHAPQDAIKDTSCLFAHLWVVYFDKIWGAINE